jgi:hypothetical protein
MSGLMRPSSVGPKLLKLSGTISSGELSSPSMSATAPTAIAFLALIGPPSVP